MNDQLPHITTECDVCVIGGGLSGSFAALSAARHGAKVVLVQDRPMLGGNASSEVRMWVRGAKKPFDRETGLISELEERNIYYNPSLNSTQFDTTLYSMLAENENVTLIMNASCLDAECENDRITSVTAWQLTTYTYQTVRAKIFIDCSGDSVLAPLVGAEYRKGRESKAEFGESLAQDEADEKTMGMSIILAARETDHPVKFTPPPFAHKYDSDDCFMTKAAEKFEHLRSHTPATSGDNLWWIELGGDGDSLLGSDKLRPELLASVYGVWDHIKNYGDHGMENWELEWVGCLPGKRESRRYVGDVIVTEHDVVSGGNFPDEIAFGGWGLDDHNPLGMKSAGGKTQGASKVIPVENIYGLPFRALYSKNVENLMFAGRNISVTHVALSSTRVMGTCALLGQAAGSGAALCIKYDADPRRVYAEHIAELQRTLMDDGAFLPHFKRETSAIARAATLNVTDEMRNALMSGIERPRNDIDENLLVQNVGDTLSFTFDKPQEIKTLRIMFDRDYTRESVSVNRKMRVFAMKLHTGFDFEPVRVAATTVKSFTVFADGKPVYEDDNNFLALRKIPLNLTASKIDIRWNSTHGCDKVRVYSADFID